MLARPAELSNCAKLRSVGRFSRGHAIQQNLVAGNSQQQARIPGELHDRAQFIPGSLQESGGSLVVYTVKAHGFQEDVEAASEASGRNEIGFFCHVPYANCYSPRVL